MICIRRRHLTRDWKDEKLTFWSMSHSTAVRVVATLTICPFSPAGENYKNHVLCSAVLAAVLDGAAGTLVPNLDFLLRSCSQLEVVVDLVIRSMIKSIRVRSSFVLTVPGALCSTPGFFKCMHIYKILHQKNDQRCPKRCAVSLKSIIHG